jgi:hypothetical protein
MSFAPNPVYPELVEGLHFSSCGARNLRKKNSASTSSAWTGFGMVEFVR